MIITQIVREPTPTVTINSTVRYIARRKKGKWMRSPNVLIIGHGKTLCCLSPPPVDRGVEWLN
jgi:hypothetical protein